MAIEIIKSRFASAVRFVCACPCGCVFRAEKEDLIPGSRNNFWFTCPECKTSAEGYLMKSPKGEEVAKRFLATVAPQS